MQAMPSKKFEKFARFEILTGLRALLLLWVMFVHLPTDAVPEFLSGPHAKWRFGVDFFLAISGFLVTRSLLQGAPAQTAPLAARATSVRRYLERRVARIFPAYYVMLAVIGLTAVVLRGGLLDHLREITDILPSFPLFFANYTIPAAAEKVPHALLILWSMSFQEQFYLLLAAFFFAAGGNLGRWLLAACLGSVALRVYLAFGPWALQDHRGYYEGWLHLNFDSIGWGCLAWLAREPLSKLWTTRTRAWITNSLLLAAIYAVIVIPGLFDGNDRVFVVNQALKAVLFALGIVAVSELENSTGLFARTLKTTVARRVGNAAFEVYLVHVYIYGFVQKAHFLKGVYALPALFGVSLVVGVIFYEKFSAPVQDGLKKWMRGLGAKRPAVGGAAEA